MRLLLDTHSFLWFMMGSPKLSGRARSLIEDESNERLFSSASLWELAIKLSLGKLSLSEPFDVLIPRELSTNGIVVLRMEIAHFSVLATLPFHHRDPFDRLLIKREPLLES